jgi:hypothetical protein
MSIVNPEAAQIEACADIVQKSIEWNAKIDIARIEANAQQIKEMFAAINKQIGRTDAALMSLLKELERHQRMKNSAAEK